MTASRWLNKALSCCLICTIAGSDSQGAGLNFSANPTAGEISQARVFEEPLIPIGGQPGEDENAALAAALLGYAERKRPDDFSSLTKFLTENPESSWRAAVFTGLGIEYYNTAHYSRALDAWEKGWSLTKNLADAKAKAIADRAAGELAFMYGRLGRMEDLEALLKTVEKRVFVGPATEKIAGAKEGLWNMQHRPEIAFRCGPLALLRIQSASHPTNRAEMAIYESASTKQGFALSQVAELSKKIGLNYQMVFREKDGEFVVPSVVHWKLGHYAAIIRREGDRYLLQDPTFLNDVWATEEALKAESSGYFLIPPGPLPEGWRSVEAKEGQTIWGKGNTQTKDGGLGDPRTSDGPCKGMAVSSVNLMLVSLHLQDEPVGYTPPVGPAVNFKVSYNHRDGFQPGNFSYANLGPKWTCEWVSYITDNPQSSLADVNYYVRGGGNRLFNGFNTNTQTFAYQQYDQTQLKRLGSAHYEMVGRDGSKLVFAQSDGSVGTTRKVFLSQIIDPASNAVTLRYDGSLRLTNITDAIGQATTLTYSTNDPYKIIRVTDPFGRFASFSYDHLSRLTNIADVIGINSRFVYEGSSDFINALITPYGTNTFIRSESGTTRSLETVYADGSRDRVEFNQGTTLGIPFSDPSASVPQGMNTHNEYLWFRNTYYWSRTACATAYGDYSKAKVYHWLHTSDVTMCAGILESVKEPLEGRVWRDYAGQGDPIFVGISSRPTHVGRVLDDGNTQLYTYGYNGFGNVTNTVDPVGRTFSYIYDTNGIDLLEIRMTRAGKNELLYKTTYNAQHQPLTHTDAAGQTTTNTYNSRGQLLNTSNPKGETTTYTYNTNGYLIAVDGPLPGTNDTLTATYDAFGRTQSKTDESGYTVTLAYDALNRVTNITYPDATFDQVTYYRLDPSIIGDRAGRQTFLEHDALRNLVKQTDPLGRVSQFQWCNCGSLKSFIDPMGRLTEWQMDVQGRLAAKQYGDGSKTTYLYEKASGRLRQIVDTKLKIQQFVYNPDNTVRSISYLNTPVATPAVTYAYDPDYVRPVSMSDGIGTTLYSYNPVNGFSALGAGQLISVDGPYASDTITYGYDELGRRVGTTINGISTAKIYDAAGRVIIETNALGSFTYAYEGASRRLQGTVFPNGQTTTNSYDDNLHDRRLLQITHQIGPTPISAFCYGWDISADHIATWSQQAGTAPADHYTFSYDAADRLWSATVTNSGSLINTFAYAYDPDDNRLMEVVGGVTNSATYNTLNELSTTSMMVAARTNEWDGKGRLVAVNSGNTRTEFTYDGLRHLASIRQLTNGVEASLRKFLWCDGRICEERNAANSVTKQFFKEGMKIVSGTNAGNYFYTRDHLGSIREVTDDGGSVRSRYAYDPYGRQTLTSGDMESEFGFASMFWCREAQLSLTMFRAYDPELGRWLSRDPLRNAEIKEGANLYAYVGNNPINGVDPLGLCCEKEARDLSNILMPGLPNSEVAPECHFLKTLQYNSCTDFAPIGPLGSRRFSAECVSANVQVLTRCEEPLRRRWIECMLRPCGSLPCAKVGSGGGNLGGGFPDAGASPGSGEADIDDPGREEQATASTGRPGERQSSQGVPDVAPGDSYPQR